MPVRIFYGRARYSEGARADVKVSAARSIDAVAALAAGAFAFAYRYLSFERFPNDHFVVLSRAQQVLMGALPVRDYSEFQAPLAVMASAWAQITFGPGLHSELLLVCCAFAVASAVAYLVTASLSGSVGVGIACALILTAATPVTYAYPKVLPYVLAFGAAWLYAQKPRLGRLWLLAAAVVFGGLLRHDHAIVLGAGAAVAVFVAHRDTVQGTRAVAHLALAGVALAAPYIIWVQRYEGVANYVAANVDAARTEGRNTAWSPVSLEPDESRPHWIKLAEPQEPIVYVRWRPNLSDEARQRLETEHGLRLRGDIEKEAGQYDASGANARTLGALIRDPAVQETAGVDLRTGELMDRRPWIAHVLQYVVLPGDGLRPVFVGLLYYVLWLLPVGAACLVAARWTRLAPHTRSIAVMAIAVELVMCAEMLRDPLATRVRDIVAPLVLVLASMSVAIRPLAVSRSARWSARGALAALFVAVGVAVAGAGSFGPNLRETGIARGWQGVTARVGEIRARYVTPYERIGFKPDRMIEYVMTCTAPQSRILAIAVVQQLFFYTNRGFAGGLDALSGFYTSDRQATQILQRLSREDVPLVVLDNEFAGSMAQTYPRIAGYVTEHYHEIGRFDINEDKAYILLAENGRMPVRSFGDLPCFASPQQSQLSRSQ
jgi:hypothetical protein